MTKHFILWITLGLFYIESAKGQISCYQCNVDLSRPLTHDCTDPYVPTPLDHLLPCPEDEPHHCITATILYNRNDVTLRGCVPSRRLDTYCNESNFRSFSDAEVNCTFCDSNACNDSSLEGKPYSDLVLGLLVLILVNFQGIIFGQ